MCENLMQITFRSPEKALGDVKTIAYFICVGFVLLRSQLIESKSSSSTT